MRKVQKAKRADMAIFIKNTEQIKSIRAACRVVADTHRILEQAVCPGITTRELNQIAKEYMNSQGATPSFLGYRGYPADICASINEEVIHGIPGLRKLKDGDIISIDVGAVLNGFHGDAARTHAVGDISEEATRLIKVTRECFFEAMKFARHNRHLYEISAAVQKHAEANGFSVVREFVGHGIGRQMHEEPQIPNYKMPSRGPRLSKGMTLCIEPMVNVGVADIRVLNDNWTVVTKDKKYSAHYENTIVITDGEPEILTMYETDR